MQLVALYFPGVTLVGNLAIGVVLLYGGVRVIDHAMAVGVLVTFMLYLRRFFEPLQDVSQFYSTLPVGRGRAGEDLRGARRGSVGARAGESGLAAAG